ncbi:MAG TPA: HAMP domain-containing sensor histidine kinase [Polyangia bacterium]
MSLRRVFLIAVTAMSMLAVGAAVALMAITGNLRQITKSLGDNTYSLNVVRSLEVDLLSHARSNGDDVTRIGLETKMFSRLEEARGFVGTSEEGRLLDTAADKIRDYLRSAHRSKIESADGLLPSSEVIPRARDSSPTPLGAAFAALEELANVNVDQARHAQARARQLDTFSDLLGSVTAVALIVGVLAIALWLQRSAVEPLLRLRAAIEGLGSGDRDARALETGPTELRDLATQFNHLATALERQRSQQVAFLGGIAHDLRNPLSALSASMMLFAPERPLPSEQRIRQATELVKRQVGRLNRMIGDLLDAARVEAGELELRFEVRDANSIAHEVGELMRDVSPDHELELGISPAAVPLRCDPLRIEQVLTNLVSNAIKYSPPGSRVILAVERRERQVGFRVTDEGSGIAPADLAGVFEPFRRTAASRRSIPGVGLGLPVAKRIVEAHGGQIQIDSKVGVGTTVWVWFRESALERMGGDNRALVARPQRSAAGQG